MDKLELLRDLKNQTLGLQYRDHAELDALKRRAEMIIRNVFGSDNKYLTDLSGISFSPMVYPTTSEEEVSAWQDGGRELVNLIQTMEEELNLFQLREPRVVTETPSDEQSRKVFVVHGQDD